MRVLIRRRPLLRAAAIAGGSYSVGREQIESHQREAHTTALAAPANDTVKELVQLGALHDAGVLTDQEFAHRKAKLLG